MSVWSGLPARAYLRLCGCRRPAEVLADVREEMAHRRRGGEGPVRVALWGLRQVAVVGLYELRDWRRRPRQIWPGLALTLGLRSIFRRPAVPFLAAVTLGLGFGAAAAIYGTYVGFNRPLPVPDGDEVRWVRVLDERGRGVALDGEDLDLVRGTPDTFDQVGAHRTAAVSLRSPKGYPVRLGSAALSSTVFDLLRTPPQLGRLPRAGEDDVVVLGHDAWQSHFEAEPGILGEVVLIDGAARTVVGVMPAGYEFPFNEWLWTPLLPGAEGGDLEIVARLAAGVDPDRAADAVAARLQARRLAADSNALPLRVELPGFTNKRGEGGENMILATLLVLVVALVLVSCSNVSNLLLARALARVDLLAVHAAIGAGPVQVFVQVLAEALLISLAGAMVGLGLAAGAIQYIQSTLSGHWGYYWMRVQFEPAVVFFVLGLAVVAGTVAGMLPATRLLRQGLSDVLRSGSASVGGRGGRLSAGLLNLQVAISAVALVIAMLMVGALMRSRPSPDLRADDVYVLSVFLDGERYDSAEDRRELRTSVAAGLLAGDEVTELAWANVIPGLANSFERFEIEGVERDPEDRPTGAPVVAADPAYFGMFGLGVVAGDALEAHAGSDELVAVVNRSFVATYLQGLPPLEQRIRLQHTGDNEWIRIVGVVGDLAAYRNTRTNQLARVYLPFADVEPRTFHALFAGTEQAANALRTELTSIEPDLGVTGLFSNAEQPKVRDVVDYIGRIYQTGGVLAGLGGLSTALVALIGLYGALVFEVQRRLAEIGVRKALGADQRSVLRYVARRGLGAVAPGLIFGFLVSAGFSPLLGVFLGRMNARDPFIYTGVFLAFVAVAAAATLIPGARAARVDPVAVLRSE